MIQVQKRGVTAEHLRFSATKATLLFFVIDKLMEKAYYKQICVFCVLMITKCVTVFYLVFMVEHDVLVGLEQRTA